MTMPCSGQISINDANVELGTSGQRSMNDASTRTLFGIASGQIAMSDGYCKSNAYTIELIVIAGGGGGACDAGGGGGAGGIVQAVNITVSSGVGNAVVVGAGGTGGTSALWRGNKDIQQN